jgi:transposase
MADVHGKGVVMREPQEIPDEEYEQILERVAAIDVAKASGMACTRVPHDVQAGKRRTRVWEVDATTNAVLELGEHLVRERVEKVTLEATSDYWRIWFYLLEAAGLDVQLVRAQDVKQAPGRPKSDKLDAVWLAKLTERGMLRPSFVPPAEIRQLRDYTRLRTDLARERTRHYSRLEKLLEDALIKVSSVASKLDTLSVRDMVEALIAGERDPQVLAGLARGRMRVKHAALVEALTGRFDDHHGELARMLLDQIDALTAQMGKLTTRIEKLIAAMPAAQGVDADGTTGPDAGRGAGAPVLPAADRLDEITGIGRDGAQAIIAEIGLHMGVFPTPGHLVSWAKLSPRTIQSRAQAPLRQDRQGQPLPQGNARRSRRRGRPHRHLPRRALPADRQTPRQTQGPGRHRPHHLGHHLAPARRPRRPLPRPRRRLLRQPYRHGPQGPQPRPPARSARVQRHPGGCCLTSGNTGHGSAGRCRAPSKGPSFSG